VLEQTRRHLLLQVRCAVLEPYRDIVGGTRDAIRQMNKTQQDDLLKTAAAIDRALASDRTPLRLPLGADSFDAVRLHAKKLLADLTVWEATARSMAIE
jgi:hypothetical protein